MKKLVLILVGVFGLLVLAAAVVPLVVNVDKYRPMIMEKADEHLNGKLELGHLGLSLWGRVKINIDGLKLADAAGRSVVEVKDASFDLPFMSLLSGHPEVRLHLVAPLVNVVKEKTGKLNALTLVKAAPAGVSTGAGGPGAKGAPGSTAPPSRTEVPAIVMNSRITVLLDHAKLAYKDELTGDSYAVNDLNFRLEDVSPSSDMPFQLSANLDLLVQKHIKVTGPLVFEGDVKATSSGGVFEKADAHASVKLDDVAINDPGLFEKKKGVPLGAELTASVGKDSFSVPKIQFRLAEVAINGEASGKTSGAATTVDFKAHSNQVDLAKLAELSPLITKYGVNGVIELSVTASGPTDKLGYGAHVKFDKITLSNDALKQPLHVNGSLAVVTNQLQNLDVRVTAPKGFNLSLDGNVQNFAAPKFKFKLVSSEMDLDGLLKSSEKAAAARKQRAEAQMSHQGQAASSGASEAPVVDYNAMLAPLHANPIAAAAAGTVDFNFKQIKSTGVVIDDLSGQLALNNLLLALKELSMRIFDGSIKGAMSLNARAKKPEVATNITMSGLQTQKMVESSMPIARNTVKGAISGALNIGGVGLNQSDILASWKGNGSLDIKNAVFSTLDLGRQLKEGVIDRLPPPAKKLTDGKIPDKLLDWKGEYENVGAKFALANGMMNINEINGKAYPNKGLDMKGSGKIKLASYGLDLVLDFIDTYNWFHLNETFKDPHYGKFAVQARVGNTLFAPKFDWGHTIEKLAQAALRGVGAQKAQELLKKHLGNNPALGNAVNGLLNKLGGGSNGSGGNNNSQNNSKPAEQIGNALKGLFGR